MATRLIGTDSVDPRLPDVVIAATQGLTADDLAPGDTLASANAYTDAAIDAIVVSGSMTGTTVDTGEAYRVILFSNGTTRAIPIDAVAPALPTGLATTIRVNSVKLTWTAASGAATYIIYRDGTELATTPSSATPNYRDASVVVGETYEYTVRAISHYSLRSGISSGVSAFVDPALNVAPTCEIRSWPPTIAAGGNRAIIRVNSLDVDGQTLATTLGVDAGTLIATSDPSVWHLEV